MGRDGMRWDGIGCDVMGWDGVELDSFDFDWIGFGLDSTGLDWIGLDGIVGLNREGIFIVSTKRKTTRQTHTCIHTYPPPKNTHTQHTFSAFPSISLGPL